MEGPPSHAVIRRATVDASGTTNDQTPGEKLLDVPHDEGIYRFFISPSGERLTATVQLNDFASRFAGLDDLWSVSLNDGKVRKLTFDQGGYDNVSWSVDEKQIAYVSVEGEGRSPDLSWSAPWTVYVQDLVTGKRRRVFREKPSATGAPAHSLQWVPRSQRLLYSSAYPAGLFLFRLDGGVPLRLSDEGPDGFSTDARYAFWSKYDRSSGTALEA